MAVTFVIHYSEQCQSSLHGSDQFVLPRHPQDNDTSLCHNAGCASERGLSIASICWPPGQPMTLLPHQSSVDNRGLCYLRVPTGGFLLRVSFLLACSFGVNPGHACITRWGQCAVTLGLLNICCPRGSTRVRSSVRLEVTKVSPLT